MENFNFSKIKDAKDGKDILDAVGKIVALQQQLNNPTRDGVIWALQDARAVASDEIRQIGHDQGDTILMPWEYFSNQDSYRKLSQYQNGLRQYCIKKIGQKAFEELLKGALEKRQSTWMSVVYMNTYLWLSN